jgi:hypothetical protein
VISLVAAALMAFAPPEAEAEALPELPRPEIEVGARLFLRPEARINEDFSPNQPDDMWRIRQGARANVQGFWGPASVKVGLQHVYDWGGGPTPQSGATNRSGLFEGYLDVVGERGSVSGFLRVGRQWFALGSERLLAYRYWQPGNQSIDAIRAEGSVGRFTIGAFGSLLAPPGTFVVTDDSDPPVETEVQTHGHLFGAAYLAVRAHRAIEVEGYAYGWNEGPIEGDPTRERRLQTYQARVLGEPIDGLKYSAEGNVQLGTMDDRDHEAWSLAGQVDYELQRDGVRPGFGAVYEIYSGERCVNEPDDPAGCGATESRDFNRLLGIGHRFRGHMDLVAPLNTRTLTVRTWLVPDPTVRIGLDYDFFQLHEVDGKWTYNNSAPVGLGWNLENTSHNLGHEIDVEVNYRPWKQLSIRPEYGVFIPDDAARRIAGSAPQHFVFIWIVAEIAKRW